MTAGRRRLTNTGRLHYRPVGVGTNVIRDPFSHRAICPTCSRDYLNQRLAESCRLSHPPVVPGEATMKPRRPDYVPAGAVYVPIAERRRRRKLRWSILLTVIGVVLALGAAAVAGKLLADMGEPGRGPGSPLWVTPTTYGPPGPTGGPL